MAERKNRSTAGKKRAPKKKTGVKKSAAKNRTTGKKPAKRKKSSSRGRTNNSVYILIIVILLAIIAFLANKLYFKDSFTKSGRGRIITSKDIKRDKKNSKADRKNISGKDRKADLKEQKRVSAKIYFIRFNEKNEKMYLAPVKRSVKIKSKVKDAIEELIKGLSPADKRRGLLSAVPDNIKLRSVKLRNRIAELDFNSSIERGAAGNILLSRIDQIVYTATQFDDVDSVVIKINGKIRRTLGSDGLSIRGPLHRRE